VPRPLRFQKPGALHHVIVRGNERRPMFFEDRDRLEYLDRLRRCRERFGFFVYAYCLMTNHAHLAIEQGEVGISRIMQVLQSSYAQSLNRRRDRVGHLFQGRFKSFLVESERYLMALLAYIHQNPVEAGIVERAEDYPWSSDRFFRIGRGPAWLDLERALQQLAPDPRSGVGRYLQRMGEPEGRWTSYKELPAIAGAVRGHEDFAERALGQLPTPRPRARRVGVEELAAAFVGCQGTTIERLRLDGKRQPEASSRILVAWIGRARYGVPVARVARFFGREESSIVRGVLALERRIASDGEVRRLAIAVARKVDRELHDYTVDP
jgi:putative transposase